MAVLHADPQGAAAVAAALQAAGVPAPPTGECGPPPSAWTRVNAHHVCARMSTLVPCACLQCWAACQIRSTWLPQPRWLACPTRCTSLSLCSRWCVHAPIKRQCAAQNTTSHSSRRASWSTFMHMHTPSPVSAGGGVRACWRRQPGCLASAGGRPWHHHPRSFSFPRLLSTRLRTDRGGPAARGRRTAGDARGGCHPNTLVARPRCPAASRAVNGCRGAGDATR